MAHAGAILKDPPRTGAHSRSVVVRAIAVGAWLFAILLLFAAGAKTLDTTPLNDSLTLGLGLGEPASTILGPAIIGWEAVLAIMLVSRATRPVALPLVAVTMLVFLIGGHIALSSGAVSSCGCFGEVLSPAHLGIDPDRAAAFTNARNAALTALAFTLAGVDWWARRRSRPGAE